jgi:formylglycine-generating enzyme required for sulfatase activity
MARDMTRNLVSEGVATADRQRCLSYAERDWRPVLWAALLAAALVLLAIGVAKSGALEPFTQDIEGTLVKFDMVPVPGGPFEMKNPEKPAEALTVEIKPFWIGKTEVTWDQYDVYLYRLDIENGRGYAPPDRHAGPEPGPGPDGISRPTMPYGTVDEGFGHKGYPAIHVSYFAASEYCRWLSMKTKRKYRLPTEAEWEYACRAGALPGGPIQDAGQLGAMACYFDNSQTVTSAVGKKDPNAWGICDMLGNVSEWCTGIGKEKAVCRGGSYLDRASSVHPAAREIDTPDWNLSDPQDPKSRWWLANASFVGFRVVCEP